MKMQNNFSRENPPLSHENIVDTSNRMIFQCIWQGISKE